MPAETIRLRRTGPACSVWDADADSGRDFAQGQEGEVSLALARQLLSGDGWERVPQVDGRSISTKDVEE